MKIVISHVYSSHNGGDAAILSAQISELKRTFNEPELSILSVDQIKPGYKFDGVPVFSSLMYGAVDPANSTLKKLVLALSMMIYTGFWAIVFRYSRRSLPLPAAWRTPIRLVSEADMVIGVGGGYLRAKPDSRSTVILLLLFHQIWLAKLLKRPVYLYAQSFGPYPKKIQRLIAGWGLRRADLILVREAQSLDLLNSLSLKQTPIRKVPDSAFMFKPLPSARAKALLSSNRSRQIVGVTVREWLPPAAQARYEAAMARFIDHLSRQAGLSIMVIAQVTSAHHNDDDRLVGQRLERLIGPRPNVVFLNEQLDHRDIKSVISGLSYLVGTRFHSVIFALTAGVPVIAIEYEHKTSGIMQDLGLGSWVIAMEDVSSQKLDQLFERLVDQRGAYLSQLKTIIPAYVAAAHDSGQLIKRAYQEHLASLESEASQSAP